MHFSAVLLLCVGISHITWVRAAIKEGECEVCVKFVTYLANELEKEGDEGRRDIQSFIKKRCKLTKDKENRFCYYIGGLDESATGMMKDLVPKFENFFPPEKICESIKKNNPQVCELKYEKPLDWKNINLKKMRVKELKKILSDWGEDCRGCLEKQDFIKRIEELKPQYVREEL